MSQKQELGKGIKALLGNIKKEALTENEIHSKSSINFIPLNQIVVNSQQPRNEFDQSELNELAHSIKTLGLIQPITIRKLSENQYQIISGERRFRASKIAGLQEIPAYIRTANDNEMLEMALVENIQRVDLNPIEIAITYQRLLEELQITQEQLSDRVGKQRSTISNYARLLKLSPDIQSAVKSNTISMGHARVLVGFDNLLLQKQLFDATISNHLSVRALEKLAQEFSKKLTKKTIPKSVNPESVSPMIRSLQDKLSSTLGTKVEIKRNEKGDGQIIIRFKNDQALNEVLDRLDII